MNLAELAAKHGTDKEPNYLRNYARHFDPLREREIHLLELGIFEGSSLKMWRDFFPNGLIAGLDLDPVEVDGCRTYAGSQDDVTVPIGSSTSAGPLTSSSTTRPISPIRPGRASGTSGHTCGSAATTSSRTGGPAIGPIGPTESATATQSTWPAWSA